MDFASLFEKNCFGRFPLADLLMNFLVLSNRSWQFFYLSSSMAVPSSVCKLWRHLCRWFSSCTDLTVLVLEITLNWRAERRTRLLGLETVTTLISVTLLGFYLMVLLCSSQLCRRSIRFGHRDIYSKCAICIPETTRHSAANGPLLRIRPSKRTRKPYREDSQIKFSLARLKTADSLPETIWKPHRATLRT